MRNVFLVGVVLALIGLGAWYFTSIPTIAAEASEEEWASYIASAGGADAYARFTELVSPLPLSRQHELAHRFGGALYTAENVSGLAACDNQFSYGCFHEFLARAIAEHGIAIINELSDRCAEKSGTELNCQHGLGHGVLASRGYTFEDIEASLKNCDALNSPTPGGCFGGAFMEYNMRTMLSGDEGVRPMEENVYDVCDALPSRYTRACHYSLPQWWNAHLRAEERVSAYKKMGERCALLSGDARRSCFAGTGIEVVTDMRGSVEEGKAYCAAAGQGEDRALCLALATQAFPPDDPRRSELCSTLTGEQKVLCDTYGKDQELVLTLQGFSI